jgi:cysteine desulfurase/selenocysteine lyase
MDYRLQELRGIPGLRTIGAPTERAGVVSLVIDGFRSEDIGAALDKYGIAVRAGHHCAQPTLRRFGLASTVRPSLAVYNSFDDVDVLTDALESITRGRTLAPIT